jgi:hypothetical protein
MIRYYSLLFPSIVVLVLLVLLVLVVLVVVVGVLVLVGVALMMLFFSSAISLFSSSRCFRMTLSKALSAVLLICCTACTSPCSSRTCSLVRMSCWKEDIQLVNYICLYNYIYMYVCANIESEVANALFEDFLCESCFRSLR